MARRKKSPYGIEYSPLSREHLAALSARQRATVLDEVDVQLLHQPAQLLEAGHAARGHAEPEAAAAQSARTLRASHRRARVYYEVDEERRMVEIRAVGIEDPDRVFIGGEEIDLS